MLYYCCVTAQRNYELRDYDMGDSAVRITYAQESPF